MSRPQDSGIATPHALLAVALHALLLEEGFICVGANTAAVSAAASGASGFAPAERDVPEDQLLPAGWIDAEEGGSFFFTYRPPPKQSCTCRARLVVAAIAIGHQLAVHARVAGGAPTSSSSAKQPSEAQSSVELDVPSLVDEAGIDALSSTSTISSAASSTNTGNSSSSSSSSAAATSPRLAFLLAVAAALAPLTDAAKGEGLASAIRTQLLEPLSPGLGLSVPGTAAAATASSSSSSSSSSAASRATTAQAGSAPSSAGNNNNNRRPPPPSSYSDDADGDDDGDGSRGVYGIPRPGGSGGRRGGDFDRDLYPDLSPAGPGWLIGGFGGSGGGGGGGEFGGGGGNLVGPGHPLFGGGGGGGGGLGGMGGGGSFAPPGARFDPFGPPGTGIGVPGRGGGGGRGGGRGGLGRGGGGGGGGGGWIGGEPPPDHLRPPPDLGDEPPPDIYW